ncbi:MAG: hypothetical protein NVSMB23_22760 [Myxococcales bacterium]
MVIGATLVLAAATGTLRSVVRRSAQVAVFVGAGALVVGHLAGMGADAALPQGGTVAVRAAAGAAVLALLAATTAPSAFAAALRALRLPAALVEVLALTQRYVSVLGGAAQTSWEAQTLRLGYCGWRRSMRSGGELVGLALLRALAQAEATTEAATARGGGFAGLGVPKALSRRDRQTAAVFGTSWIALTAISFGGGR